MKQPKNSRSESIDKISMKKLKQIEEEISFFIEDFINTSAMSASVPDEIKIAETTPIFKPGDKSKPENYRPISQLPTILTEEGK